MDEFDALDTLIITLAADTDGLLKLESRLRDYATFVGWTHTVHTAQLTPAQREEGERFAARFLESARHGIET